MHRLISEDGFYKIDQIKKQALLSEFAFTWKSLFLFGSFVAESYGCLQIFLFELGL